MSGKELTNNENRLTLEEMVFTDNITGYPHNIVPNIVHYVLFKTHEIEFSHFISILSVLKNQKPDEIIIHCDCDQLVGDYYERIQKFIQKLETKFTIRTIERPTEIFGKKLSKEYALWHASDITRIKVLIEFGGIYLDRDIYVVKSLDNFRKYEMTLSWDEGMNLGNQVFIAHKNARFLKKYLDSYHNYDGKQWYYNGGQLPTKSILHKNPELIHRVKLEFGVDGIRVCPKLYHSYNPNWQKEFYTIHFLMRGNVPAIWCIGKGKPSIPIFNEETSVKLNDTFGEMIRVLLEDIDV